MLKAIKINLDEKINGIEFIIGPISPSRSLFGPKLQNCIHATCLYYIHHKFLPQLISIGIARCKLFIKKNVEVLEQILKLKDIGIPALFFIINRDLLHFNILLDMWRPPGWRSPDSIL